MNAPVISRSENTSLLLLTTIRCLAGLPVEHSLELLKTTSQAKPEIALSEIFFRTIRQEGLFAFANTILTNIPRRLLREVVRWPIIGYTNDLLIKNAPHRFEREGMKAKIITSCSSAFFNTLLVMPFEQLIAYRIKEHKTYSTFFYERFRVEGISSLYRGVKINLIREYIFCMTYLAINQEVKKKFDLAHKGDNPLLKQGITSFLIGVGIVAWGLPIDFLKVKIQMDLKYQNEKTLEVVKMLFRTYGFRGFYRGAIPTFLHSVFHATTGSFILDKIYSHKSE